MTVTSTGLKSGAAIPYAVVNAVLPVSAQPLIVSVYTSNPSVKTPRILKSSDGLLVESCRKRSRHGWSLRIPLSVQMLTSFWPQWGVCGMC